VLVADGVVLGEETFSGVPHSRGWPAPHPNNKPLRLRCATRCTAVIMLMLFFTCSP